MNNKGSKLLLMDNSLSNSQLDNINSKASLITSDCKLLLIKEMSSYFSDYESITSIKVEEKVGEIALGQEGSKFLQDLIIRIPELKEYVFQIVSLFHMNIIVTWRFS